MKYTILPNSELKVSKLCLGTMTFGEQNTEKEAHEQLNYAVERGINFIDTAEMYPIAAKESTLGLTEKYIGSWLQHQKREELVIASKIAGPNRGMNYIRENLDFSKKNITSAVEHSLRNLQTDYIDLYQLHWPERKMNFFGQRGFSIDKNDKWQDNFNDILTTFDTLIKEGKIKNIGISNETPFGLKRFLEESKYNNLPRISTIQNPYSLLNRLFEVGLAEICYREKVGLLAYSPLGFGVLSGKHQNGILPESRNGLFPQFTRYTNENCIKATDMYIKLAAKHGLNITQLALAFVQHQEIVTATIIGATNLDQLRENIDTNNLQLDNEIIEEINKIQSLIPDPAP